MTKEDYMNHFIQNPKYSSPWVEIAATVITEFPEQVDEEFCAKYNNDQLRVIYDMLKYNATATEHTIDLDIYARPEFNDTQMHLFLSAFQQAQGDFEEMLQKIADPKYTYEKINYIVVGLIDGLDLSDHIDDFNGQQLAAIYSGFKDGIDITKYDDCRISADMMNIMRCCMIWGHDISYDLETNTLTVTKK